MASIRLSICIPTWNRSWALPSALEAAAREQEANPPGEVEILVSDNASTDDTAAVLDGLERIYRFRRWRHPEDILAERNFLSCVEQAQGEFVWLVGDDDQLRPGSVARILRALDEGADLCLVGAMECDRQLRPLAARAWYREPYPDSRWFIDSPRALGEYFDRCRYLAGVCGFISVMVFRRDRFLACRSDFNRGHNTGFAHAWAMQRYLQTPTWLHWIPGPLVNNRLAADEPILFVRLMLDVDAWGQLADWFYGKDPVLRNKILAVARRNQMDRQVTALRVHSAGDPAKWVRARGQLLRLGYPERLVQAVDLGYRIFTTGFRPSPVLDPEGLCLCSLPLLARGARRIALVALGGDADLPELDRVLHCFQAQGGAERLRVLGRPGWAGRWPGVELQGIEGERLGLPGYLEDQSAALRAFAPDLVVHADPARTLPGDLLAGAAQAAGSLAFRAGAGDAVDPRVRAALDAGCNLLMEPEAAWGEAICRALGLRN